MYYISTAPVKIEKRTVQNQNQNQEIKYQIQLICLIDGKNKSR